MIITLEGSERVIVREILYQRFLDILFKLIDLELDDHEREELEYKKQKLGAVVERLDSPREDLSILIHDVDGNPIRIGDLFTFKYLEQLGKEVELRGSFSWCSTDLRYEIDIYDNVRYTCLSYDGNGVMRGFKLIK